MCNSNAKNVLYLILRDNCSNLISIDLGNFDTRYVKHLDYMFYNCTSLISLNLSNFKTPRLIQTDYIFCNCSSLQSLDISNIDTSRVTTMEENVRQLFEA